MITLSTTGILSTIVIADLGGREFSHPTVDYDLTSEYEFEEIRNSESIMDLLDAGHVSLKKDGIVVANSEDLSVLEVSTGGNGGDTYYIKTLVNIHVKEKDVRDINYKTELKSGNKLHDVQEFSADGFLETTEFYDGYVDPSNKGNNAIKITETYTTDPAHASLYPSARAVETRNKTRAWYLTDGSLDELNIKTTTKNYDTQAKKNNEGQRRRNNIINKLTENTAMGGIFSGVFADGNDAHVKLVDLMELHSGAFSTYITSGRGHIYDDLTAESSVAWLDTVVLDTPYTQAMVPQMIGMTLRNYILEKLKGNIL